jgi:SAM-dependent methyltransferase
VAFDVLKSKVRTGWQRLLRRIGGSSFFVWKSGLWEEVAFWDEWLGTRGLKWPQAFARRMDPQTAIEPQLVALLDHPPGSVVKILDVGAGPLTAVGQVWEGRTVEVTAVDPLAAEYDKLLAKHKLTPPVRTRFAHAEKLLDVFAPNTFDLVFARNCIDHSYDPLLAFGQMLAVAKPGACVFLDHAVNEADHQGHGGLHQWNFCESGGQFIVEGRGQKRNATVEFAPQADTECRVQDGKIFVTMRKRAAS